MVDVAAAVVGFLTCVCTPNSINTPVVERCKCVMNPKKYIKKLGKLKADIIDGQKDLIRKLEEAECDPGLMRAYVVARLLKNIDLFLEETNVIEEERPNLNVFLPNCCSRRRMGSSVARLLRDAKELLKKIGELSDRKLTIPAERREIQIPAERTFGEATAHKTVERIWGCLTNNEVSAVGVYGMGGVGKTRIVMEINNRLFKEKLLFDLVIWVTVSKSTSIRQIQDKIASALNHSLPHTEDDVLVSASLHGALKLRKKVVLILDDMWEEVSLLDIGIPEPTQENGCKILLTTRNLEVCRRMGCGENSTIKVKLLSKTEAWELFEHKVKVVLSEEVRKIAESVVEECACLPLAIVTVGGAMRGTAHIREWQVALQDLKNFESQKIDGMETKVFGCLKFSYDRLPDENVKKCFLYCALFPEDWPIEAEKLIDYWIMEGQIEGESIQDEIEQGESVLNKLRNHCLLEDGDNKGVKMHVLVRDMALKYTSLLPSFVEAGVSHKKLPCELKWREDLLCASFMSNKIEEIVISPRCPKLSILLLNFNYELRSIHENFFVQLQGLRVLDLSQNKNIESLPDSISDLVNLRGLLLEGCRKLRSLPSLSKLKLLRTLDLRDNHRLQSLPDSISEVTNLLVLRLSYCRELKSVPSVAKLRSLRKLELNDSGIRELPQGMEMLVNLTFLNLDQTKFKSRGTTPSGILSALSSLKNLHLDGLPQETIYALGRSNGEIWEDLLSLKQLESLYIIFSSLAVCANYIGSPNYKSLETFRIGVGFIDVEGCFANYTPLSNDIYRSFIARDPVDVSYHLSFLPQNTQYFHIQGFKDMRSLNDLRCLKDARRLRECFISNCDSLEYIIKHEEEDESTMLQGLQVLKIEYCSKLHSVYEGNLSSICCLTRLVIDGCYNLKNVFSSPRLLQQLQSLEHIEISGCKQMEEIIEAKTAVEDGEATNTITLPKLSHLIVWRLPKLKNIWVGEMVCDSLEVLRVMECPKMKRISTLKGKNQLVPPLLSGIKGSSEWWDSLKWDNPSTKRLFLPYFHLTHY